MRTINRIMGIISLALGVLCILPSIIGMFSGASLMSDEQLAYRAIAYILFELFIFVGSIITISLASKPIATIFASILLIAAGFLQINFIAEFNLAFIGSISLLILSWVAVISIVFGLVIFMFSIITIRRQKQANDTVIQKTESKSENLYPIIEKCVNCEANIPDKERFCPECGHEIVLIDDTIKSETNTVSKKKRKIKPLVLIVSILLLVTIAGIFVGSILSNKSILPTNANDDELKLINYIIENGEYDSKNKVYAIDESTMESGIYFNYIIEYSTETKKLTFKENQYVSEISTATYTTMYYEYGAKEQKIEVNMVMDSKYGVKSSGIIRPATYTSSNRTIYSFESTSTNANIQSICENNVYAMLSHCQLLMIDADTGLVPFGFEKGLFK